MSTFSGYKIGEMGINSNNHGTHFAHDNDVITEGTIDGAPVIVSARRNYYPVSPISDPYWNRYKK